MIIIMLGAPGAGKGTIGKRLAVQLGITHLSSGDVFRALTKDNTKLGEEIKECINNGKLIPDKLAMQIFEDKIVKYNLEKGIILDGYPRTLMQAKHLDKLFKNMELKVDIAMNIDVEDQLIIDRIVNRRICLNSRCGEIYNLKYGKIPKVEGICDKCGENLIQRADDNEDTVKDRLKIYDENTRPLLKYYNKRGVLWNVHSAEDTSIDDIVHQTMVHIEDID